MNRIILLTLFIWLSSQTGYGQAVGISSTGELPNQAAILDVSSNDQGVLLPRMTASEKANIADPVLGLTIYQTDQKTGYYVFQNDQWVHLGPTNFNDDLVIQELDSSPSFNFGSSALGNYLAFTLYDSGGPNGNYQNNENNIFINTVGGALGYIIILEECNLEAGFDSLFVQGVKGWTGITSDSIFVAGNQLSIKFTSNNEGNQAGFKLTWQAVFPSEETNPNINMISGWQFEPSKVAVFGGVGSDQSFNSDSLGQFAVNFGDRNKSIGIATTTFGANNRNTSNYGLVTGLENNISGDYSIVTGFNNTDTNGNNIISGGNNNINGYRNLVSGQGSEISGSRNVLNGNYNEIDGDENILNGELNSIDGNGNLMVGSDNVINFEKEYNILGGEVNYSYGHSNLVIGYNNGSQSNNSIIAGIGNVSGFNNSLVIGVDNFSYIDNSMILGKWADSFVNPNDIDPQYPLFAIGVGTSSSNRINGLEFTDKGKLILGYNKDEEVNLLNDNQFRHSQGFQTLGGLEKAGILSSLEGDSETGGIFFNGDAVTIWSPGDGQDNDGLGSASLIIVDEDQWSDNNGNPYDNGAIEAYLDVAGLWQQSDEQKKENIQRFDHSLDKILSLTAYSYQFKINAEERAKGQQQRTTLGLLAQEVQAVMPEAVTVSDHGDYFVNYSQLVPVLIESIKELKAEIEELKKK